MIWHQQSRKNKSCWSYCLLVVFIFNIVFPMNLGFTKAEAADVATPLNYYKDTSENTTEANYRYFVGMMYYDMWYGSSWQHQLAPYRGDEGLAEQDYQFSFPNRTIKSIDVTLYKYNSQNAIYFESSRTEKPEEGESLWKIYSPAISTDTEERKLTYTKNGIGTSTATIPIKVKILLNAKEAKDITDTCTTQCSPTTQGLRIYLPVLFKIELDSKLSVYYKTKDGKSLNSVFPPREEEMKPGSEYEFTAPTNEKYKYIGYKKTTDGTDPSKQPNIQEGEPPKFKYNGSFEEYRAYQYYDVVEGCKPGQTSADNPDCDDPDLPSEGKGDCTFTILPPTQSQELSKAMMNPEASGHILGDDAANGRHFDATRGIPTSENLYANAWGYNYLFSHKFGEMKGKVDYQCKVKVKYSLKWKQKNNKGDWKTKTASSTKTYNFGFTRDYSYWQINQLAAYGIQQAKMNNYALPNGSVTITAAGYTPPSIEKEDSTDVNDHVRPDETGAINYHPGVIDGGKSGKPSVPNDEGKLKGMAESKTDDPEVRNDDAKFTFKSKETEIMNGDWTRKTTVKPKEIPAPTKIRSYKDSTERILFKGSQLISLKLTNKANTPATGTIFYTMVDENVNGDGDHNYPITAINNVTVYTPVVNYSSISDDKIHNQKTVPDVKRMALILDRPFTVRIPTSGQHQNESAYPGYGKRDFAKYFRIKQVLFPFDVYAKDGQTFYPKNTWIDVPVNQLDTVFNLPVWVDEGNYTVLFRNIAENAPGSFTAEQDANFDLNNHVAKDTVDVEVIGRIYDFHVTDIADFNWEKVFRTAKGSSSATGKSYWVGPNGIDGELRGNSTPYTLPIMRGSNPLNGFKNVAVKTGYHFKFDVKTKGNMFADKDALRITPTFYYQDKDASTQPERVPVDLYYHSDNKKFIKIGSVSDTEKRSITLNHRLRNVSAAAIKNTAASIYDLADGWTINKEQYIANFIKRSNKPTYSGGYDIQILTSPLRTFINTFERPANASASAARVNASIQQWYGEYSLPANVYAVPKGTDLAEYGRSHTLDEKAPIFLKKGFIVVNFDLESIVNGDTNNPHLQYIHTGSGYNNQWWDMEGYDNTDGNRDHIVKDPYHVSYIVKDGDVVFYDTDLSSYNDFAASGTH
ncbi:DUF5704 domain-containing protein [Paenibacillus bovis]|nr:DUF5704 domain-containing protein [Paenibacillus bovis]